MRFVDEYRNEADARKLLTAIERTVTRPWMIMEICGGQTHTLIKSGIDRMLPPEITLVHGPGCPVCVTPLELIDKSIAIARRPEVILTSFGDMLRVPGSADRSAGSARRRAATCAWSTRRWMRSSWRRNTRIVRWCFSPSVSRPRRPAMRWPSGKRGSWG